MKQRAAICALKVCAYSLAYLEQGEAALAQKYSALAAKLAAAAVGDFSAKLVAMTLMCEHRLSTLDASLI